MVKSNITTRLADGAAAVPGAPPGATANCGANGARDNVVVEHYRLSDFELPKSTVSTHLICLHLSSPKKLHWRESGGRQGSRVMLPGE